MTELVKTVGAHLQTMYTGGMESTPMEIDAVSAHAPWSGSSGSSLVCLCCGRMGHGKADCRFKDADCRTFGKKGHLSNAHKSSGGKGKGQPSPSPCIYHGGKDKSE